MHVGCEGRNECLNIQTYEVAQWILHSLAMKGKGQEFLMQVVPMSVALSAVSLASKSVHGACLPKKRRSHYWGESGIECTLLDVELDILRSTNWRIPANWGIADLLYHAEVMEPLSDAEQLVLKYTISASYEDLLPKAGGTSTVTLYQARTADPVTVATACFACFLDETGIGIPKGLKQKLDPDDTVVDTALMKKRILQWAYHRLVEEIRRTEHFSYEAFHRDNQDSFLDRAYFKLVYETLYVLANEVQDGE